MRGDIIIQFVYGLGNKIIKGATKKNIKVSSALEHVPTSMCAQQRFSSLIKILWNNTFIKADDNTLFYTDWCNKGIMYFKDIINETDKTVESFGKLRERYSLSNNDFLKYTVAQYPNCMEIKDKKRKFKYTNCANIDKSNS